MVSSFIDEMRKIFKKREGKSISAQLEKIKKGRKKK